MPPASTSKNSSPLQANPEPGKPGEFEIGRILHLKSKIPKYLIGLVGVGFMPARPNEVRLSRKGDLRLSAHAAGIKPAPTSPIRYFGILDLRCRIRPISNLLCRSRSSPLCRVL